MATGYKKCKVCGKVYPYCRTQLPGTFRWQDVACCHEHALIYFEQIEQARNEGNSSEEASVEAPVVTEQEKPITTKKSKRASGKTE